MPEYKKKHVNRFERLSNHNKKNIRDENISEDIEMTPHGKKEPKPQKTSSMRVVKGKKQQNKLKIKRVTFALIIVLLIAFLLQIILPGGIIENVQNMTSIIGSGSYPENLDGTQTINCVSRGLYYYVLTNSSITAFSNAGKMIFTYNHGYENPVLKTSKTRAMVFEQGGNSANIYNLSKLKSSITSDKEIITANISDSGYYAIVTKPETYASAVKIYNNKDKVAFEWYSSEDTINNVVVSPNGKKIALSLFNSSGGVFKSKVSVFNFESATPEFTQNYDNSLIYELNSFHNSGFYVVTSNKVNFINWSKYKSSDYSNEYSLLLFKSGSGGAVAVYNRPSDNTDNKIALFNTNGQLKTEFDYKGIIKDIQVSKGHIYCLGDSNSFILGDNGAYLRKSECGFGSEKITVLGTNLVGVVSDNKIEKIKLEENGLKQNN